MLYTYSCIYIYNIWTQAVGFCLRQPVSRDPIDSDSLGATRWNWRDRGHLRWKMRWWFSDPSGDLTNLNGTKWFQKQQRW